MKYTEEEILEVYNSYSKKSLNVFMLLTPLKLLGIPDFYLGKIWRGCLLLISTLIIFVGFIVSYLRVNENNHTLFLVFIILVVLDITVCMMWGTVELFRAWIEKLKDKDGKKLLKMSDKKLLEQYLQSIRENK
ncbi:hypothetical protein [Mycoplasma phocoenae]|uniref:Uncharacterized protein n=1 Tax=Mycoplasma phocoenae TaxID=754517 RepID=A0A858U6C6_9MOLU|nr:hypothetical protein [Mycoplasma phocoenae]QJG66815.1 hypothetical protein HGG69_00505 [Mycoplasma phocoenae]